VGIVATQIPERTRDEKRPSPASGARANVAKQDISHILALQQHALLPLAGSSVFVALSQPGVGIANVANLIDMPGASNTQQLPSAQVPITSNAPRSSSFSYFANRGPANQVDGQGCLHPTGLVAVLHARTNASHDTIEEEEPKMQEPCSAYDVNVRTSDIFACALANKIQLAIDDDFMAALQTQIFDLELHLYHSQEQCNELFYATHDQIWEAKETRKIDRINLQNNVMQVDRIIF